VEILLWLGASLAAASLLGLFWKGRGRPGRPAGWLLPSIGTLLVAGAGFGLLGFAGWAETAGVRPGWFRFAASLWVASLSGGLALGLWSRRVRPISGRWLVTGMVFGVLVLLAGFYGADAGLRPLYESRLIEAEEALERLEEGAGGAVVFSPWDPSDHGSQQSQRQDAASDRQDLLRCKGCLLVLLGPARDAYREEEPLELPPGDR
jgi:hypothetical protein